MASAGNLQPMPPFDPKMDISTVVQRWQQWLKRFKRYLLAMDIKSKARQRAMLLYAAGPEVEAVFDSLPDNGEDDDFDTACEKLNEYFSPEEVGQADRKASWVPVPNCARDFIDSMAVVE